ncbi:MAG: hypothetical protein HY423_05185, partial [Candidatus Lambdaproteobacteria bacterium]|nr:hypothetical protein [Candidatus Lambdaproteobacteria bacterium]
MATPPGTRPGTEPPPHDPAAAAEWIEYYYRPDWGDGLPLVPPTRAAVEAMLAAGGLRAEETLGEVPERAVQVGAEKVAINAVMAGCLPAYFPVVVAAVRGLCHPDFHYHNPGTSTGGSAFAIVVNGPIALRLGINGGDNAFGSGVRANATIGRAVRLVMMNVFRSRPGLLDKATLGSPGKYSFCFAEWEADSPWEPLHVERGFRPEQSTATIFASNSLLGVYNQHASTPEPLLLELADALCNLASPNVRGFNQALLAIGGDHARLFRDAGWDKPRIKAFLMAHARRTVADFKRAGRLDGEPTPADETAWRRVIG